MDIATGAIGSIVSKLTDLLKAEYKLQTGVKKQVESLTRELESAQDFLQEIDTVPPDQLNRQAKRWADEVRDASYDMEDILDTFLVSVKGPNSTTDDTRLKRLQKKLRGLLISKTKARHNIANAIEEVKEKLKEIDERHRRYKLDDLVASHATPRSRIDPRIFHYGTKESLLIGIDERKDAVVKMLSQDDHVSANNRKIVSLLGFGGAGKTTLARAIHNQLKQQYECGAFVSVGQKPDLVKVFKDILYDLDPVFKKIRSTQRGVDLLVQELLQFLKHKRYFIVIDDVWEIESRERIIKALTDNDIGSRIIITTRNSKVSTGMVYEVRPLSEDNSKKLFYTRIFGAEDKCPDNQRGKVSQLVEKILKKCGGVPLALITMASLLIGKSMEEWYDVRNSIGFRDKDREQTSDIEWILSLSYYDLPSHLKTCLLYLSVFPEDHLISKHALIWMWIAEGFVNGGKPRDGLFEVGEGYFNELINRSLIQQVEDQDSMIVKGCRVHDMILDLIRSLSREANFAMVLNSGDGTSAGSNVPRRLSLQNRTAEDTPPGNCTDTTRARSLIAFSCHFVPGVQLERFKILRVLYLDGCEYTDFDKHAGDLNHLRCLGIVEPCIGIDELPKQIIGELKFLRVLYLYSLHGVLPSSVGMLTQLVCLHAPYMGLPSGSIRDLTSLQELQIFSFEEVDKSKGSFVKDLRNLSELRVLMVVGYKMDSDFVTSGNLHKLQHFMGGIIIYIGLPSCIHPSHLPWLSHLDLILSSLSDKDLETLGGLPQLSYRRLDICEGSATLTGTADRGYFQMLRSCLLPRSTVQIGSTRRTRVFHSLFGVTTMMPALPSVPKG